VERYWSIGSFLLSAHGFAFCQVQKFLMCNLVALHALDPGLDLGPEVQEPQKSEKVCLRGGGHQDLGKMAFTQHQFISKSGLHLSSMRVKAKEQLIYKEMLN